jgi:hypothetical protein
VDLNGLEPFWFRLPTMGDVMRSSVNAGLAAACSWLAACGGRSTLQHEPPPDGCLIWQDEFLLMEEGGLLVGVRPSAGFRRRPIGKPDCGGVESNTLALSSAGDAYVADTQGRLFRVDWQLECEPLLGPVDELTLFGGMSFVDDASGRELIKYVHWIDEQNFLGTIDPVVPDRDVGPALEGSRYSTELAGSRDGRLFALNAGNVETERSFLELDAESGEILSEVAFGPGLGLSSLAAVRWENVVYGFLANAMDQPSRVFRFDVELGTVQELSRFPTVAIGAGTSSCAADLGLELPK